MKDRTFEIKIEKLIYGGCGLGRHRGKVIFVPFSAPGDRLLVRAVEEKKTFTRAEIVKLLECGSGRGEPRCRYFGSCGGCQWQHLAYAHQIDAKRKILEEAFHHRFPGTKDLLIGMKACTRDYGYRSRARLQVKGSGPTRRVGFFRFQSHDVQDIDFCPLLQSTLNTALASIRDSRQRSVAPSGPCQLEIACAEDTQSWEAAQVAGEPDENRSSPSSPLQVQDAPVLQRLIGEYRYTVSPAAFFQANDFMLTELVSIAMEHAQGTPNRSALDLYCGVGLFTLPLARRFKRVLGVDNSRLACDLARTNAEAAGLENVRIICDGVAGWIQSSGTGSSQEFDLILLDPPRTGAGPEVMNRIRECAPEKIIYVSCDPQTLIRDLAAIPAREYRIDYIQGLDLFPQTYHFETVVRLTRVIARTFPVAQ